MWESIRIQPNVRWRDSIKLLKLKVWKIAVVFLVAFIWQAVFGSILMLLQKRFRPDFVDSLPDGFSEFMQAYSSDPLTSLVLSISALCSFLLGGYVAGKLSSDQYLAPYSHAAIGVILHQLLTIALMWNTICDCFTVESGGRLLLGILFGILSSILGVKLAIRKSILPSKRFAESLDSELNALSAPAPTTANAQFAHHTSKFNTHDGKKLQKLPRKRGKHKKQGRRR